MVKTSIRRIFIYVIICSLLISGEPQAVYSAVIGGTGSIPAGGTAGKDGGMCSATIYRVGIITESMSYGNTFHEEYDNQQVVEKLENHFSNHFPRMENSIMFVPSICHTTNASIGWFESSNGELRLVRRSANQTLHDSRVRLMSPTNSDPGHLYYNALETRSPSNPPSGVPAGDVSKLVNGGWKNIINSVGTSGAHGVWNYLLGNPSQITDRIKIYIGDSDMDSEEVIINQRGRLKFLDLLMTLYALYPAGSEQREYYDAAIERFLKMENLDTRPIVFAIDTAVRFSAPSVLGSGSFAYIPTTDYIQWMHGAAPKSLITSPDFQVPTGSRWNSEAIIELGARRSMAELPKRLRNTDKPSDTDGFTWAYGGVVGKILRTNTSAGTVNWYTSSATGVMRSLVFKDQMYGFIVAGGPHNKIRPPKDVVCQCKQAVTIPDKSSISGKVKENPVGKKVSMFIDILPKESSAEAREAWNEVLDMTRADTLQMQVKLWRSGAAGSPSWTKVEGPSSFVVDHGPEQFVSVTKEQIKSYLDDQKLAYVDDLMDYEVPEGETHNIRYNASVTIRGTLLNGQQWIAQCSQGNSVEITLIGPDLDPEVGTYTSVPSYWSEIKQGSPGNETFEAMAGTPTTRNLYFATGGSEFIVDVEVEYVPDATSTRRYRSYFSGGVPSEFKLGDQAPNYTVPSPSGASSSSLTVNGHQGGTVTATWTGTLPYTGSVTWGDHWVNINNRWDYAAYDAAKAQAQAWASAVNGFTITHKAASDGQTRSFNGWGASITTDSKSEPAGSANPGQSAIPAVPCSGNPCTGGNPGRPYVAASGTNGSNGTYTITVTGTLPARIIDGPSSTYDLPMIEDTWTQTVTYDYTKINRVQVWKIDRSKVNGMSALTGTDEVTASIVQGDPVIFSNIANNALLSTQASAQGRLRYSVETDQHDNVVWYEGPRTNKDDGRGNNGRISGPGQSASWATGIDWTNNDYGNVADYHISSTDAKDRATTEWQMFDERRRTPGIVTAVSDFLILHTSSGDQSVMYFESMNVIPVQVQRQTDVPKTSFDDQWTNNPLSAAQWSENQIHIGSYNGDFSNPGAKYSTRLTNQVKTIFDDYPAGKVRPARPAQALRLMRTGIDVIDTVPNGEYITGASEVFYRNILNYPSGSPGKVYPITQSPAYGAAGAVFATAYSDYHDKVNDIIIHNPVSVEGAMIVSLPASRDQRTAASKVNGGNLQQPTIDYERRLNPNYRQNLVNNGNAEQTGLTGQVAGWSTWTPTPGANVVFTSRSSGQWVISGAKSFEIQTRSHADGGVNYTGVYYKDVTVKPNTQYKFSGKLSCHRCAGYFYIDFYNGESSVGTTGQIQGAVNSISVPMEKTATFTTGANVNKLRIHIVKSNTVNGQVGSRDNLFADDIRLENMSVNEWIQTDPVYDWQEVDNPHYVPPAPGSAEVLAFTGGVQQFTAPRTGTYVLEAWGAQGMQGGHGGYAKGTRTLNAGDVLHVYVGGQNGFNGGGAGGAGASPGTNGGGATDIRLGGTALSNRIIVAGGGGGRGGPSNGGSPNNINSQAGAAGGAAGVAGSDYSNGQGGKGGLAGTSSSGGAGGQGGETTSTSSSDGTYYQAGGGGGGGGYYGGGGGGSGSIRGGCSNRNGTTGLNGALGVGGQGSSAYHSSGVCGYHSYPGGGGGGGSSWAGSLGAQVVAGGNQSMPNPDGGTMAGRTGNGYVRITLPEQPAVGSPKMLAPVMISPGTNRPPEEAYEYVEIEYDPAAPVTTPSGTYTPGQFINLDWGFQVRFPNTGSFYGNGAHGIAATSDIPGLGFTTPMDTTEWTARKQVKFSFYVTYAGVTYSPDTWINLPVAQDMYDFYLPLANREAISALVEFQVVANNGSYAETEAKVNNKAREFRKAARHSAWKAWNVDIVGRIGALAIEDTGDFRFSNVFKQPVTPVEWLVPNVVRKVNPHAQNRIAADSVNIRGETGTLGNGFLDTYGLLPHLRQSPLALPLSPEQNGIAALQRQPMRIGYQILSDIQTIGNYYDGMQIIPYYYHLNLATGALTEADVYMQIENEYKPINLFGAAVPGWDPNTVHPFVYTLDWNAEAPRRNYTEAGLTQYVVDEFTHTDDTGATTGPAMPFGTQYAFGTAQIMQLTGRNRTFIGTETSAGINRNPAQVIQREMFGLQGQRWHFSLGLPSSAAVVARGSQPTQANRDALRNNDSVILAALDIKSIGDMYVLQYTKSNGSIQIGGITRSIASIPHPVVAVYSASRSSADDLTVSGTH